MTGKRNERTKLVGVTSVAILLVLIFSAVLAIMPPGAAASTVATVTRDLPNSVEVNEQFTVALTQTGFAPGLNLGVVWEVLPPGFEYVTGSYTGGAPDRVAYNPTSRTLKVWFFNETAITYQVKASSYAQTAVFSGTYSAYVYYRINESYGVESGSVTGDTTVIVGVPAGPSIELTPASYNFGMIPVGQCSAEYAFTLKNTGGDTATGSVSLTGTHESQFTITSGGGSFSLAAGQSKTITVKFCPTTTSSKSAALYADGTNCADDYSSLTGGGEELPTIELTPAIYSFGTVQEGQCSAEYSFTLTNTGGGTATGSVSLTGTQATQFTITSGGGSFSLGPGASKTIKVKFCPTSAGTKTATLFADGANCNDAASSLSGTGAGAPAIALTPASYNFGTAQAGQCSAEHSFTLTNNGGGTATGSVYLTGSLANQFTITSGGGSFSLTAGQSKTIK
ncbi:MAG: choice-of-anchor D domain-containing protein, partial [Candidatus Methanospirareceae archaeon]